MRVTREDNVELHKVLFGNWSNYEMWSPKFAGFVRAAHERHHVIPGIQWPGGLNINDSVKQDFFAWLRDVGIDIPDNLLENKCFETIF